VPAGRRRQLRIGAEAAAPSRPCQPPPDRL